MFHRKHATRSLLAPMVIVILFAIAAGVAACGDGAGNKGALEHPKGVNEVVLRVSAGGGFVTPQTNLRSVPQFTLYGDGTIIVTGPMIEIYPGPALPNLQTIKVSEETIQAMLSAAQEAGLLANGVDYGRPGITDMPSTTITVNADGQTYESNIYALGVDAPSSGLSLEQQQARAAINELVGRFGDVSGFEQGLSWTAYKFESLRIYSSAAMTDQGTDIQPNKLDWPLGDLSTLGEPTDPEGYRKAVVTGADLEKLRPLLDQATEITVWNSAAKEYNVVFRPLLPDETA